MRHGDQSPWHYKLYPDSAEYKYERWIYIDYNAVVAATDARLDMLIYVRPEIYEFRISKVRAAKRENDINGRHMIGVDIAQGVNIKSIGKEAE